MHHPFVALVFGASLALAIPAALPAQPTAAATREAGTPAPGGGTQRDTLPERWARPFAVEARGGTARRSPQTTAVRAEPESAPTLPTTAAATATAAAVPSAPPARPAPAPPAPPAAPTTTTPARAAARTHAVAAGETFMAVARRYGVSYSALLAANPGLDPDRIRPGQSLRLPAGPRTHLVVRGETLFAIARRYGLAPERIRAANRLTDDRVKIGQTLVIPAK